MALKFHAAIHLSLQLSPSPTLFAPSFCKPQKLLKSLVKKTHVCQSSLVDEQQQQISFNEQENQLINALVGIQGRGKSASPQQLNEVGHAVKVLEGLEGVSEPTGSNLIEGRWQLMFTTRPGTASPIQRTFVGVDFFSVFQEVYLRTNDPRVSNIVKFSNAIGELKVEAAATIENGKRILFQFDRAAFSFNFLPFKVPYPVPFRLLGDEAKGWLDTTYLSPSGNLRISRGNKGTTFVLQKKTEPRQRLLSAIGTGTGVLEMETDSWIENAGRGLMGKQIVTKNGQLKFVVDILLGVRFSMTGTFVKSSLNTYDVKMDDAAIIGGMFGLPVEMETKINLELLYSDDKIRISRGYKNIVFVHARTDGTRQN
uniref:Plastid lipid-associated protein/fibrillin conserved domain-containing protein n=1 Tax=Populus trichocarpa TaxID=3694 RepID=A0A2K2BQN3_POPTR